MRRHYKTHAEATRDAIMEVLVNGPEYRGTLDLKVGNLLSQSRLFNPKLMSTARPLVQNHMQLRRLNDQAIVRKFRHKRNVYHYLRGQVPEQFNVKDIGDRTVLVDWLIDQRRGAEAEKWRKTIL